MLCGHNIFVHTTKKKMENIDMIEEAKCPECGYHSLENNIMLDKDGSKLIYIINLFCSACGSRWKDNGTMVMV